jgi:uncharacterized membrane protein YjjB (DUF3815 family)
MIGAATFAGAALVFLYGHDPSAHAYYPRCVFHALTGLQCPGCGATRALYHLLHGDFRAAIQFNLLFVLATPALAFGTAAEGIAIWNNRATRLLQHRWISSSVVVLVAGWGVIRNL